MRAILFATVALLPFAAGATDIGFVGIENVQNNNARASAAATATARASSSSRSASAATGGAASASVNGSGGSSSVTFNDRLQAPGLASYAAPSGPCVGVSTFATGSVAGFGIGGGRSEIEDECQVREAARLLHSFGQTGEALTLIRNLPSVRRAAPQPAPVRTVSAEPAPAPVVAAAPAQATARPDWCDTASGPERRRVAYIRECAQ